MPSQKEESEYACWGIVLLVAASEYEQTGDADAKSIDELDSERRGSAKTV